jgi:hypothetical protein
MSAELNGGMGCACGEDKKTPSNSPLPENVEGALIPDMSDELV